VATAPTEFQAKIKKYVKKNHICVMFMLFGKCGHTEQRNRYHQTFKYVKSLVGQDHYIMHDIKKVEQQIASLETSLKALKLNVQKYQTNNSLVAEASSLRLNFRPLRKQLTFIKNQIPPSRKNLTLKEIIQGEQNTSLLANDAMYDDYPDQIIIQRQRFKKHTRYYGRNKKQDAFWVKCAEQDRLQSIAFLEECERLRFPREQNSPFDQIRHIEGLVEALANF